MPTATIIPIEDEMRRSYLDYAMSTIIGRALPDVRDGLKPVHRRILFAMYELNNMHDKPYKKSARVVGDVIGKYHPHGDQAVYDAITRMVQDFSLRYPLIDGQGNFGSIDGDSPAAMRYTEVRLSRIAEEILEDIEKDTVEFKLNYDESLKEPVVLPSRAPNLLINGSSGIAVGMATNIPPHNMTEVINGTIAYIDNPSITIGELMAHIPGPDFPTEALIYGRKGIRDAYETGRGHILLRATTNIEKNKKDGRESIIITQLPYQVNKARLIENIVELINDKKIEGISNIRDESNREGIRVVIELKKNEIALPILNKLYKQTQLQTTFGIIFLTIVNNQPKYLNLKEMISRVRQFQEGSGDQEVYVRAEQGGRPAPHPRRSQGRPGQYRSGGRHHKTGEEYGGSEKRPHRRLPAFREAGPEHPRHAPCPAHVPRAHEDPGRADRNPGRDKAVDGHPPGRVAPHGRHQDGA